MTRSPRNQQNKHGDTSYTLKRGTTTGEDRMSKLIGARLLHMCSHKPEEQPSVPLSTFGVIHRKLSKSCIKLVKFSECGTVAADLVSSTQQMRVSTRLAMGVVYACFPFRYCYRLCALRVAHYRSYCSCRAVPRPSCLRCARLLVEHVYAYMSMSSYRAVLYGFSVPGPS